MQYKIGAKQLCYDIAKKLEEDYPQWYKEFETTYYDVVKLALLTLYEKVVNGGDLQNLPFTPFRLSDVNTANVSYFDDLSDHRTAKTKISNEVEL